MHRNSVARITDHPDMTSAVDCALTQPTNQKDIWEFRKITYSALPFFSVMPMRWFVELQFVNETYYSAMVDQTSLAFRRFTSMKYYNFVSVDM